MAIDIISNKLKYKNSNGNYDNLTLVSDESLTAVKSEINNLITELKEAAPPNVTKVNYTVDQMNKSNARYAGVSWEKAKFTIDTEGEEQGYTADSNAKTIGLVSQNRHKIYSVTISHAEEATNNLEIKVCVGNNKNTGSDNFGTRSDWISEGTINIQGLFDEINKNKPNATYWYIIARSASDPSRDISIEEGSNLITLNPINNAQNILDNFAPTFDETKTYSTGEYVIDSWNQDLYRLTNDHTTGTTWNNTNKKQVTIGNEIAEIRRTIIEKTNNLLPDYNNIRWTAQTSIVVTKDEGCLIINGARSSSATVITVTNDFILPIGNYCLGVANSLAGTGAGLQLYDVTNSAIIDSKSHVTTNMNFSLSETTTVRFRIHINANSSFNNLKITPMLFSGTDALPTTYMPLHTAIDAVAREHANINMNNFAESFNAATAYTAGQYVIYDGDKKLYRLTEDHTENTTWANTSKMLVTVGGDINAVTKISLKNLWQWGDQIVPGGHITISGVSIPAGEYMLSATIERSATRNCRMYFYNGSPDQVSVNTLVGSTYVTANGTRQASPNEGQYKLVLTEEANTIQIFAGLQDTETITATWRDIQLESGSTATDYEPYFTAYDRQARQDLAYLSSACVRYDIYQEMSDEHKERAQSNIGLRCSTHNLWTFGDQTFTGYKDFNINLAAGEYVLSAKVVSTKDNAEAPSYNARIEFTTADDGTVYTTICRNFHAAVLVSIPSVVSQIRLYASNTSGNSADTIGTWTDIQLESGSFRTPYVPPYLPYQETHAAPSDVLIEVENVTIDSGRQWRFNTVREAVDPRNVLIECEAKWTGDATDEYHVPEARFFYSSGDQGTGYYDVGQKNFYKICQWRLPPFPNYTNQYKNGINLEFRVPEGLTLYIRKMVVRYDNVQNRASTGLTIHTHGSFLYYPQHSLPAIWAAAKCGATHFITIPKRTKIGENNTGGEWICYHDDTFDESTTILRTAAGELITNSGYGGNAFTNIPWSWLKTLDSGVYKNAQFTGTRLMLVEEMLEVCAKTGMHPVFSWHPWSSESDVQNFRGLLEKYDMVGKTSILPSKNFFTESAYPVFGNDIEMYKFGPNRGSASTSTVQELIDLINGTSQLDKTKCCIAIWVTDATPELIAMIRDAGIQAGLHQYSHTSPSGRSNEAFSAGAYRYWMRQGVTVFTDSHNSSIGLNW